MILRTIVDQDRQPQVFVHEHKAGKAGRKTGKAGREMSPDEVQVFCRDIVIKKYLEEGATIRRVRLKELIDSWADFYLEGEKYEKEIRVEYRESPETYKAIENQPLRVLETGKVVFPVVVYVSLRETGIGAPFPKTAGPCRLLCGGSYYAQISFRSALSIQDEPDYFGICHPHPSIEPIRDACLALDYLAIKEQLSESVQFAKTGRFDVVTSRQEFMLLLYDAFMRMKEAGKVPEVRVLQQSKEQEPVLIIDEKNGFDVVRFGFLGDKIKELLMQPLGLYQKSQEYNPDTILPY